MLSTCNRTEVYAVAERFHGAYADVRDFLAELAFLPPEDFADHLYVHYDEAAVQHLFAVAAGLDSAVLGESEILGQVRHGLGAGPGRGGDGRRPSTCCSATPSRSASGPAPRRPSAAKHHVGLARPRWRWPPSASAASSGRRVLVSAPARWARAWPSRCRRRRVADVQVANRTWDRAADAGRRGSAATAIRLADLPARPAPRSTCC